MAHSKNTKHAHRLDDELRISLQSTLLRNVFAELFKLRILKGIRPYTWEEILDQADENRHVQSCDLRRVEVTQGSTQDRILITFWLQTFQRTSLSQQRFHSPQTPVVVHLLA